MNMVLKNKDKFGILVDEILTKHELSHNEKLKQLIVIAMGTAYMTGYQDGYNDSLIKIKLVEIKEKEEALKRVEERLKQEEDRGTNL